MVWPGLPMKTVYYIDTPSYKVVCYDHDAVPGSIQNKQTVIIIPEGYGDPDGMTIDTEGMLWITFFGADGKLHAGTRFEGKLLLKVDSPVSLLTTCTFGGKNLDDIYITSARKGLRNRN